MFNILFFAVWSRLRAVTSIMRQKIDTGDLEIFNIFIDINIFMVIRVIRVIRVIMFISNLTHESYISKVFILQGYISKVNAKVD